MISVFTPSHDSQYLDAAYVSLLRQSILEWEWVVLLNGDATWNAPNDDRVQVVSSVSSSKNVGALKAEVLTLCTGEYLVELDHDDALTSNALLEIEHAFMSNPDASLVYSDWAHIQDDGTSDNTEPWSTSAGWLYYTETVDGQSRTVVRAMEATPRNLSRIWWMPNHVRAFRRTHYDAIGGYSDMPILDDQDLVSRLYLAGPFVHIPQCLYLQRMHAGQTQRDLEINGKIQAFTVVLGDQYLPMMASQWRVRTEMARTAEHPVLGRT